MEREDAEELRCSDLILKLTERKLISETEHDQINAEESLNAKKSMVFDLMKKKDWMTSIKIIQEMQSPMSYSDENCDGKIKLQPIRNPLEVDVVIHCISGYLNLEDIKNCRLINKRWNKVTATVLGKRAMVKFISHSKYYAYTLRRPVNFVERFRNSQIEVNFTAFKFDGWGNWSHMELQEFFGQAGRFAQDLVFSDVLVSQEGDNSLDKYNLSNIISELDLRTLCICYLFAEDDDVRMDSDKKLCVNLGQLQTLKCLVLACCNVLVSDNASKISPTQIFLTNVNFFQDEEKLEQLLINEAVDFEKAEMIRLVVNPGNAETDIMLDVSNVNTVGLIELDSVILINMEFSQWTVDTLKLHSVEFSTANSMQVKNLEFSNHQIDLYVLSQAIETLLIHTPVGESTSVICTGPLFLPNLKRLILNGVNSSYAHFADCHNIVDLELNNLDDEFEIEADTLPKSIKKLKLTDVELKKGENIYHLDKLFLINYSFVLAADILEFLKPNVLVLQWDKLGTYEVPESLFPFLKETNGQAKNIVVGPFHYVPCEEFRNTKFYRQCENDDLTMHPYYSFQYNVVTKKYNKGKGLSTAEEIGQAFQF